MAVGDLCTVADLKSYLQNVSGSGDDALLARLATAASRYFYEHTGRAAGTLDSVVSITERRTGTGQVRIYTKESPITAVTSVTIEGKAITASGTDRLAQGYDFDTDSIFLRGYTFRSSPGGVDLAYSAGLSAIPADVNQAVLTLAGTIYKRRADLGKASKNSQGGLSAAFTNVDFSPFVQSVLDRWMKTQVFG